jgi:hypothetical protein
VLVGKVVRESEIRTELLETLFALGTCAVRVHHAANGGEITRLELGYSRAGFSDAANDLVAGNARVDGRHRATPFVARLVEVRMTNSTEEYLDLDIVLGWIAPRDRS